MINLSRYRPTAWLSAFTALIMAVLPPAAWAECQCGPNSCDKGQSGSSCCSTGGNQADKSISSCCAAKVEDAKIVEETSSCCCTQPQVATDCQHGQPAAQSDCECSPRRSDQAPAQQAPAAKLNLVELATLPLWAVVSPVIHDLDVSPRAYDVAAFAPPIPLRELYCVWRI